MFLWWLPYIKMNGLQQELDEFRRTPDGKVIQGCSHTSRILSHKYRNKIIMTTYQDLKKYDGSYDAIACCGTSGLMVVPQIAELLNKNIVVVRKNTDGYSDFMVEVLQLVNILLLTISYAHRSKTGKNFPCV